LKQLLLLLAGQSERVIALRLTFLKPEICEAQRLTVILSTALKMYAFFYRL
jgi:hypothetical protein